MRNHQWRKEEKFLGVQGYYRSRRGSGWLSRQEAGEFSKIWKKFS